MKKSAHNESKSLKTFYLYILIVFILMVLSLIVKGFFIIQQSRFDPAHHFALAVTEQNQVKEIISFNPQTPAIWELVIVNTTIPYASLAKNYGIETDGYIQAGDTVSLRSDAIGFLWSSIIHSGLWESDMTVYDKIRLLLLSKNVTANNKTVENITLSNQSTQIDTTAINALTDQEIATENISIKIVNATNTTGLGQRLARVLTNLGANVVDISTAQEISKKSSVAYFGNDSYTLDRIQKMLGLSATKLANQGLADIVITIGTDKQNTMEF